MTRVIIKGFSPNDFGKAVRCVRNYIQNAEKERVAYYGYFDYTEIAVSRNENIFTVERVPVEV